MRLSERNPDEPARLNEKRKEKLKHASVLHASKRIPVDDKDVNWGDVMSIVYVHVLI